MITENISYYEANKIFVTEKYSVERSFQDMEPFLPDSITLPTIDEEELGEIVKTFSTKQDPVVIEFTADQAKEWPVKKITR